MTKKRKIEILKLLRKEIKTGERVGLCSASLFLFHENKINLEEKWYLICLISHNKPENMYADIYFYMPFAVKPRIKWINERIKELQ